MLDLSEISTVFSFAFFLKSPFKAMDKIHLLLTLVYSLNNA
jgi:hypothetical protein